MSKKKKKETFQKSDRKVDKIESICIDTITSIQVDEYMTSKKNLTLDKWRDWGVLIWEFCLALQDFGFELILVLGDPGTGKSTGMMNLPHNSNIWYNTDKKNPVWTGGRQEYGTKFAPRSPYHIIPESYSEILKHIEEGIENNKFIEERYAILTGHTETYKKQGEYHSRLKTLGNQATSMNLEGKFETVLWASMDTDENPPRHIFETTNNGFNTCRSPMGLFDPIIPNDYNYVLNKIRNQY